METALVNVMWRVEIVGKKGRTVPVLITDLVKSALDELMKRRQEIGVNDSNQFVFALPNGSVHHIRGSDTLRTSPMHVAHSSQTSYGRHNSGSMLRLCLK